MKNLSNTLTNQRKLTISAEASPTPLFTQRTIEKLIEILKAFLSASIIAIVILICAAIFTKLLVRAIDIEYEAQHEITLQHKEFLSKNSSNNIIWGRADHE